MYPLGLPIIKHNKLKIKYLKSLNINKVKPVNTVTIINAVKEGTKLNSPNPQNKIVTIDKKQTYISSNI